MKSILRSLAVAATAMTAAFSISAETAPVQPVSDLLGVRPGTFVEAASSLSGGAMAAKPVFSQSRSIAPLAESAGANVTICGSVVFPDNVVGMWSYGTDKWAPARIGNNRIMATAGGVAVNGYYYCNTYLEIMGFEDIRTYAYKMSDWSEYDNFKGEINYVATTMAYNPYRDEVFGCFINAERKGYNLVQWNYDRYVPLKVVCPLERPWSGCAYSSNGTLYAIERNGDLYTVNTRTGAMTLVGSTGVKSEFIGDAIIDPATDTMYWCVASEDNYGLYSVDIATATATKLYDLENQEQICGMYLPEPEYAASVPAMISSVGPSFSGVNLSGTVNFSMPRYTVGQERLADDVNLKYTITANGKEIATGEALPGASMRVPVEITEPDSYYFVVTTSNAAGTSPKRGAKKFVGPDTPKAPTQMVITLNGSDITLQWSSISSSGVNNGSVNTSAVTYTLTRYPDAKVLVDGENVRKFVDHIDVPEKRTDYYYTLTASSSGLTSEAYKSATLSFGPIEPPFSEDFAASTSMAGWSMTGKDGAASKWAYYSYDKALRAYGSAGFDDWAFSPAVIAKAGTNYPITLSVKTSSYAEETFDICWGTEPTAEAMTNVILADQKLKSTSPAEFKGEITADKDSKIYIGIHAKTESKSNALYVLSFNIGEGLVTSVPATVTDFKAESPVNGAREATVSFTLPTKNLGGSDLEGGFALTAVEILRDGELIASLTEGLKPGTVMEYTDKDEALKPGTHTYAALAVNAYGKGNAVEAEVLVGARRPVAPASALMVEDGNTGMVTITWEPVTTDVDGNTFLPECVTYRIVDRKKETVVENLAGTSYTVRAVEEGEQAFSQFGVYAVTAGGESEKLAATAYKPVGKPYDTPWAESFADGNVSSIFGYNYIKSSEPWQFISSCEWGMTPQDEDGGFAYFEAYGAYTALVTGKINLDGVYNPALTYYTFNYAANSGTPTNAIEIQVDCGDGNGFVKVQSDVVAETGPFGQWNKVVVSLADYEGKAVVLRIVPTDASLAFYTLDNMRVSSFFETNLTASSLRAPAVADVDKDFEVDVLVSNTGERAISSYTVELMRNGELVDFKECERIEPGAFKTVTFTQRLSVIDGDEAVYQARVVSASDLYEDDNLTEEVAVGSVSLAVPVATALTAAQQGQDVVLTWTAPDLAKMPAAAKTEGFEDTESWSSTVEGWKLVDMDKTPVGGIEIANFPVSGLLSWSVADRQWGGFENNKTPERWDAHSGYKFICSEYVQRGNQPVQSDDWAISPRLYGGPQALSLYAKSFDPAYLETFEVLYSANSSNIDDFVSVGIVKDVPNSWGLYRFKLPDGAKFFAIRSRSTNKFFLFIDDVTFIPEEGDKMTAELIGYNVYRNGNKLNAELVTEPTFTDAKPSSERDHSYYVTAVYDKGESRRSNEALIRLVSGIGLTGAADVTIRTSTGAIIVNGVANDVVTVAGVDGRVLRTVDAQGSVRIAVEPGVYIVNVAGVTAKVLVK